MDDLITRALDLARTRGAQYADVRLIENRTERLGVKNGVVEVLSLAESAGFGVRVLADGAWGFASSRELTGPEVDRVTNLAFRIARAPARFRDVRVGVM